MMFVMFLYLNKYSARASVLYFYSYSLMRLSSALLHLNLKIFLETAVLFGRTTLHPLYTQYVTCIVFEKPCSLIISPSNLHSHFPCSFGCVYSCCFPRVLTWIDTSAMSVDSGTQEVQGWRIIWRKSTASAGQQVIQGLG